MELSLEKLLKIIKKHVALLIILSFLLGIGAYFGSEFLITPTYSAKIGITINGAFEDDTLANLNNSYVAASKFVKNCEQYFKSKDFLKNVRDAAQIDHRPSISISSTEETTNIVIVASENTPENAYAVAKAVGECAPVFVSQMLGGTNRITVTVYESPEIPTSPSAPNSFFNAIIAACATAIALIALFIVLELTDHKINEEADLTERYGLPIIAVIPDFNIKISKNNYYSYTYHAKEETEGENNG